MYFINADLMDDFTGAGILVGILGLDKEYFIYPVINSTLLFLDAFPYFDPSVNDDIQRTYNRDLFHFQRDTLWGDLVYISQQRNFRYTLFPHVGPNGAEIEKELWPFLGREVMMNKAEIGIFQSSVFNEILPSYKTAASFQFFSFDTTSRMTLNSRDFGYDTSQIVRLPVITRGFLFSEEEYFRLFSVASALGYISIYEDMREILEDKSGQEKWNLARVDFADSLYPLTNMYHFMNFETASSVASRMKTYLNTPLDVKYENRQMTIKAAPDGNETNYILRTLDRITNPRNCAVIRISEGFYLVTIGREDAELTIRPRQTGTFSY